MPQDKDGDSFIDYIEWEIPHLSNQTFNIVILEENNKGIADFDFASEENYFLVGERVRFNMRGIGSYSLFITSPQGKKYSRLGANDIFLYNPSVAGKYIVEVRRGGAKKEYVFYVGEGEIQGRAEINKPVLWRKMINGTVIEFLTGPPVTVESEISSKKKRIVVSSPEGLSYRDVLVYTSIREVTSRKEALRVYWVEEDRYLDFEAFDTDKNGLLDRVEWIAPHLSEQTFEIIVITKAEYLDSGRNFIGDIYESVKERDGIWSPQISEGEYVRVWFERNLTSRNDITIYPRVVSGNPKVEVYELNGEVKIAEFNEINSNDYNKIYLTNLQGEQDVFDLRVVGGVLEFDHIIDPVAFPGASIELRAQQCRAQISSTSQYVFASACDGNYPAACGAGNDLVSCNDGSSETHSGGYSGSAPVGPRYGGINITVFNSSITDCLGIKQVFLCYEMWTSATGHTCNIAVRNGSGSFTSVVSGACSNAANPGVNCVNITSNLTCLLYTSPSPRDS